jgi:hypothetical protein
LQDDLEVHFNIERQRLLCEIESLKQEISNSQITFEKYRSRAKSSLLKSVSEQQLTEKKLAEAQGFLKVMI